MRFHLSFMAVGAVLLCSLDQASAQVTVTADTIGDVQLFPGGGESSGQDRFETILGQLNGSAPRIGHVRFDLSAFSAELANPSLQLSGAEVVLTERADRDSNNGTLSGNFSAFLHSQASGDWVVPDNGGTATLAPIGVFGATWSNRRTDPFSPDEFATVLDPVVAGVDGNGRHRWSSVGGLRGTPNLFNNPGAQGGGNTNQPDVLFNSGSGDTNFGANSLRSNTAAGTTEHTFQTTTDGGLDGLDQETITINLLENVTALQFTDVLNDWVTGVNAGIGLASDIPAQVFFESADAVNDGDGTAFALDTYTGGSDTLDETGSPVTVATESGNGEGGALLNLTFSLAGNADGDGDIDLDDLTLIRQNFGTSVAPNTLGDVTGDGNVDSTDLRIWQDAFDFVQNNPPLSAANAVPEPTSLLLGALALCGLGLRRTR